MSWPPHQEGAFRLVTYNIHSCFGADRKANPERIAEVLSRLQPDLVALQEVDVGMERSGRRDQAGDIAAMLGFDSRFVAAWQKGGGDYGIAVLSRGPMEMLRTAKLPHARLQFAEPRVALAVRVAAKPLVLVNAHLGLFAEERRRQIEMLVSSQWLGGMCADGAAVLCGDFNTLRKSAEYRRLAQVMRDAFSPRDRSRSFPSRFPLVRIDHVFINDQVEVLHSAVVRNALTTKASDHCPVVVDLRLREGGGPLAAKPA